MVVEGGEKQNIVKLGFNSLSSRDTRHNSDLPLLTCTQPRPGPKVDNVQGQTAGLSHRQTLYYTRMEISQVTMLDKARL